MAAHERIAALIPVPVFGLIYKFRVYLPVLIRYEFSESITNSTYAVRSLLQEAGQYQGTAADRDAAMHEGGSTGKHVY